MGPVEARTETGRGKGAEIVSTFFAELTRAFRRTPLGRMKIRRERRLRLRETLSLGERRLVAIVECDRREFLVAATGQTISLLAPLEANAAESAAGVTAMGRAARAGR